MTPDALATLQQHVLDALSSVPDETRRLFHGRGRVWPGLEHITVDWMQGVVLVSLFREPLESELEALTRLLLELTHSPQWQQSQAHTLLLQHRYLPQSTMQCLLGELMDEWVITENELRYKVDFGKKQNSGLFLDMRYGREWVRSQAKGKRVLNLFAYTCGFSVAAIAGGADHVVNLDMAKAALNRGRENHRLNGHDLSRVSFLGHDLFKSWAKVTRSGPYDLVIIDPPSFQKGSFMLDKDYQRVLRRLPELLTEDGTVLACMNDPAVGTDFLIRHTAVEAPELRFEQRLENPPEFPDARIEGGLKALVFKADSAPRAGWA
ncbi:class I SAM-dependent methyltransferase [Pseudomonas capsici]|uniref:class I SAM-dependent methyltransferase n=1 Tax=Pseudomonas capsici TaxID=2810614 RepID=UPI001910B836|nr:class I SAM-dependent methyltransferase [Pseudomonas capsici]MBX8606597.1 class I SAM-dependent methyltransferase [Pseudomonas cichorii]MCV4289150.1 class I SAM-dependent methyltransferase [Pseudomonas capsici]GFM59989.1 methyltransferase [Pseudomonas cichorii]